MKVRVRKDGEMWIGEIYGKWESFFSEFTGWEKVTNDCFTKFGAKLELKKWIKNNIPEEFEI